VIAPSTLQGSSVRPSQPWPHPESLACCDDYLPCYCYALNFDDYDRIKEQREELLKEIEAFEEADPWTLHQYRLGVIRYADVVRPVPPAIRSYPRYTWRSSDRIENVVEDICGEIAKCDPGNRNNTLASAAFFVGKLVQGGKLDIEYAAYKLGQAARAARLPLYEAATTVRLGLQAGMRREATNPYEPRAAAMGRGSTGTTARAY